MSEFLINGNPQNIPKLKGGDVMFYTATKEQIEQLHPELINYEPNKTRCFYKYDNGEIRFFDRIYNYYFSDRPWGLEQEYLAEGLDQQWVDKKDYLSLNIRNTHKAPDGWTFVCLDYAAEEIRLGAINTGCKLYTEAFQAGKDIHTLVGEQTWGYDTYHSNKKKYRKMAKILNFNMQYGGTAFGAARLLNCSVEEAEDILNRFKGALQDHFTVQDSQVLKTHQTLCEHTFFGLPIRLHRQYSSKTYKQVSQGERLAKNCRIQGTGGDILSIAFIQLWKKIWKELSHPEDYIRFQITVHDEIDFLIRNDVLQVLIPKVIECMTIQLPEWKIPLAVGLSLGPTFGQQYEWNYGSKEEGYKLLGPALEEAKPQVKDEKQKEKEEIKEEIKIEF